MSGSGFYRFRCKNFLTYNCENWVWVNHSACAECVVCASSPAGPFALHLSICNSPYS